MYVKELYNIRQRLVSFLEHHGMYNLVVTAASVLYKHDEEMPLAGIHGPTPNNKHFQIHLNMEKILKLTPIQQVGVLAHEIWHINQIASLASLSREFIHKYGQALNVAMDAAIHESLDKLIPGFSDSLGAINVPKLNKDLDLKMQREQSFVYYFMQLLEAADKLPENNGEGLGDCAGEDAFSQASVAEAKELADYSAERGRVLASKAAGNRAFGMDMQVDKAGMLAERYRTILSRIKGTMAALDAKKVNIYNWSTFNKRLPSFPGNSTLRPVTGKVVMVLDTSGSMCAPEILNQLWHSLNYFRKQGKLFQVYNCDTELYRTTEKPDTFKGGGGTVFDSTHITSILKDLEGNTLSKKSGQLPTVVYVTDGEVDLTNAMADKRIHFVPVVVACAR
jgi:predicted metal-dependent peptidase